MSIRPVPQRQSLVVTVVEQLAHQVRSGAVAPGSRLPPESELCRLFGVSRTVVREAVARLKADELVETRRGRGLYVRNSGPVAGVLRLQSPQGDAAQVAFELLEFRAGLEADSARLAALRRTPADIKALRRAFARLAAVQGRGRSGADDDLAFHLAVARTSHNAYIVQVLEFLSGALHRAISTSREIDLKRAESLADAHAEHTAIFDAIVAGDADAAVRAMRSHLEAGRNRLLFRSA
ncbi:MAG: FadR family transcriptional regulator [Burkholderiaceae bacterium]|nr:FadR family transcriptional regulator [Burkholderiaceae bacterium]